MNGSSHDYVPHCSPVNPMRNTMTPESRSTSSSTVSPRSGLGMPPAQVLQPHLTSSQVTPAQMGSSQIAASSHVPPFAGLPSASNTPSSSAAATNAMFRVQMWSNNFDSGVQSLNHSSAPSVLSMSSLRVGSQISAMSEDAHSRVELTDQQQLKFENIPPNIGRGSQDGETRNAIPELIHLLSDSDEVVVQRAATMVQNIAKMDSEQPPYTEPLIRASEVIPPLKELLRTRSNSPAIIKPTLGALFQISERPDGLESILRVNDQTNGALLTDIIQHIRFTGGSAIRYAILTFHTIIADKSVDNRNVERARDAGALQAVAHFLDRETNEKLLSVLVECVRLLCDKSHSQKMLFLQLNGPSKLLHILRNLRYEGLLWRTTQLLKTFSNADPQAIINSGGYEVLHRQLEHASQRLITSTLECIRNMSDVPTKDLDVSMLLTKLLQLLGAVDPVVVLYCTGILSNLLANNQRNKEFVYSQGAIMAFYRVLVNSYSIPAISASQQQRVEDIQERALATLRHLCVGHPQQVDAQKAVLQTEFAAEFLLRKLTEMRPSILKQTLQILNKAALQDVNLHVLRETRVNVAPDYEATFVERIVLVLKVACEQLPSTQMVEEVRVAELIQLSLSTLQLLCRDPHLLNQIACLVRRAEFLLYRDCAGSVMLPTFCLYQRCIDDENLKRSALGLISELALHPEMAATYASDNMLMSAFEHYSRSRNQAFATYAEKAYERTMQGGNPEFIYPGILEQATVTRPPVGSVPHGPFSVTYPQSQQYPPGCGPTGTYTSHPMQCPQQTLSTYPNNGTPQETRTSLMATHAQLTYGREGPSQQCASVHSSMDYSSEVWPDDLSGLSINDDPFASMFCSQQFDSPQQRSQQQARALPCHAGNRGHETTPGALYCSPGPPGSSYDQRMQNMPMGSPEAPASWHDPSSTYGMNSEKQSKEAITPVKDSPVRSVVGDIFTTSYYLMGNSYENVEGMLKLLECKTSDKRSNASNSIIPSNNQNSSSSAMSKMQPNKKFNNEKKDLISSIRRFQSNIDLTNFSKGCITKKTKIDLLPKFNESQSTKPDPNIPTCRLIGPIRIQTAESIVYTDYGESIVEERIELIGYGPRDKTKRQIRLKPRVKRVMSTHKLEQQPDTKQTVLIADNYIRIKRSTRLKRTKKANSIPLGMPTKYTETRQFSCNGNAIKGIRNTHLNKKHRPMLTARSETALNTMRVYNLIGPLEVTAKQEVTNDENNGYTIGETLELRAANSKAEPTERLIPFVQKKQEAATDPNKGVPCKRNERIFIGDNVIVIDRIIRLSSPQSVKSFLLMEQRDYNCDKMPHTAREKSPERLKTAKSYGNTPPHYSMNSFGRSEDSLIKEWKENHEEESEDVHTAKLINSQTMQQIYNKQASIIQSKHSLQSKNTQKESRSAHTGYQRQLSNPLRDDQQGRLTDSSSKTKLGLYRETKQRYSPQTAATHRSRESERSFCSKLSKRSEPQADLRMARRLPSTNVEALDGCSITDESSSCEHSSEEANIELPGRVVRELSGVAYYIERSLRAAIQRAHTAGRGGSISTTSTKYNEVDKPSSTMNGHQCSSGSDQQQKHSSKDSRLLHITKERTRDVVDPKSNEDCTSDTVNANSRCIDRELRNRRNFQERYTGRKGVGSIRLDLLRHAPSMFDEEIKTSRSPGCCTERKLQENSSRAVASDSPRNYFGSNESDEQRAFGFSGTGHEKKESMIRDTAMQNQDQENNFARIIRIPSRAGSLGIKRNPPTETNVRNRSSTTPSEISTTTTNVSMRKDVDKSAPSRPSGNLYISQTTQHPSKQGGTEMIEREGILRAEAADGTNNNIVNATFDDRGMTVEIDLNITMKDQAGKTIPSNGNGSSYIRCVIVNGRQFYEKRDK